MLETLTTEGRNPTSEAIDSLSAIEIVRLMNAEDARVPSAIASQAEPIARAIEIIAERLRDGGRLIYLGAGTSGRLGVLDAAECPPTFNSPPEQVLGLIAGGTPALTRAIEGAEDVPENAITDLNAVALSPRDVVVGIATSGRTPYVLGGLQFARQHGTFTIGFSCNAEPQLAAVSDLLIAPVVGPEVVTGSTRLKAGTATKMVLNMLTTGAMIRLGKTYGNLMVDLRATNRKLLDRTSRIVMALTGLNAEEAEALLRRCDGELKTAVVVQQRKMSPSDARQLLQRVGGHLRQALQEQSTSENVAVANELVLGIDGGGTKTVVCLSRQLESGEWAVVGRGSSGPSNPQAVGFSTAFQNLDRAVELAFAAAKLPLVQVVAACGAVAGTGRDSDRREVERWAESRKLARHVQFTHDALPLLAAGTPDGWGVALIAGTGSLALGQNQRGESARAGGWGYLLGDEGSAYQIALAALRAMVRMTDGRGPKTQLGDLLLDKLELAQPADLVSAVYNAQVDRATIASWAELVFPSALDGDEVARRIIDRAACNLAEMVVSVCRVLQFDRTGFPLALGGGLLIHHAVYRERLMKELAARSLQPEPIAVVSEPVVGATMLAQRMWRRNSDAR